MKLRRHWFRIPKAKHGWVLPVTDEMLEDSRGWELSVGAKLTEFLNDTPRVPPLPPTNHVSVFEISGGKATIEAEFTHHRYSTREPDEYDSITVTFEDGQTLTITPTQRIDDTQYVSLSIEDRPADVTDVGIGGHPV